MQHRLSEKNIETKTAVCSVCGPVAIIPRYFKGQPTNWRCKEKFRIYLREWKKRQHPDWNRKSRGEHKYRKYKKDVCERCSFVPEHKCQLDVHHVDGDHENNSEDNLKTLCANCHRLITELERLAGIAQLVEQRTCNA